MENISLLLTQCPVIGAFIWFLVVTTKENNRRFKEQSEQFQSALDKIVDKIGDRLDKRFDKIESCYQSGITNG